MPQVNIPEMPRMTKISAKELQVFWDTFFSSQEYRASLMGRILAGDAAHMEVLLHHMVYGKPKETLELQGGGDGTMVLIIGDQTVKAQQLEDGMVRAIGDGPVIDAEPTPPSEPAPDA